MTKHCENCTCEDILANKQKELEILKQEHSYLKNIIDGPVYRFSRKIVQAMLLDLSEHEDKIKKLQEEIAKIKKHQECGGIAKSGIVHFYQEKSSTDGCKRKFLLTNCNKCDMNRSRVLFVDANTYDKLYNEHKELKKDFKDADGQRCALAEKLLDLEKAHEELEQSFVFLKKERDWLKSRLYNYFIKRTD